jgi:YopX protein
LLAAVFGLGAKNYKMQIIKYKGQRVDNKEWVTGFLVIDPKGKFRIYWQPFEETSSNTYHFVKENSLKISTGLFDKKGNEIFTGDSISHKDNKPMTVCFGQFEAGNDGYSIGYIPIGYYVKFFDGGVYCINQKGEGYAIPADDCEVVSNGR